MDIKFIPKSAQQKRVCVVVGTRPGIIKMSPIIRELGQREVPFFVLHTGQHYSHNMDRQFFDDLELPIPRYHLVTVRDHSTHASQTAEMMKGIEEALIIEKPEIVLVCGDANTNLSGALAARKLGLKVGHVEAGLRSYDWRMPEEHNRVIMDHICELLFPPTEQAKQNLVRENVRGKISVTGNTIVDASLQNSEIARRKSTILRELGLNNGDYLLLTMHREENVDDEANLKMAIDSIGLLSSQYQGFEILFPMHPRTAKRLSQTGLMGKIQSIPNLRLIQPLGYLDFLLLISHATLILTDSGGIQEEACILRVPCVTLRENTERPESITVGANMLAGLEPERVLKAAKEMTGRHRDWPNPFGDGRASCRIVDIVQSVLEGDLDLSEFENP